jgi:Mat/Ecp fimbriae major subunit
MFKIKLGRSLALVAATATFGLASHEALATSQTGHASATILAAITVTENTQLAFASISPPAGGGNVVLTPGNVISGAGFTFIGTTAAGNFTATGAATSPAVITFSSGDTLSDGASHTMAFGTFTTDAGGSPTFSGGGSLTFNVGSTLVVGAAQVAGAYTGTYTVTVNY